MYRHAFFASLAIPKIHQMAGNLFYRKVAPSEINGMSYSEMKYWNEWHKLIEKEEAKVNA